MNSPKKIFVIDFSSIDSNPLNPLGLSLRRLIWEGLDKAEKDSSIGSVILYGGGSNFSAGADLTEFGQFEKNPGSVSSEDAKRFFPLVELVNKIENFSKPVVAAISGNALGGGLEVALSCHYRVTNGTGKFGLPEVHVGVIPGAGGTQRLPRLVTVIKALEMILTGRPIGAQKAKKLGLVDELVASSEPSALLAAAKKHAESAQLMSLDDRRVGKRKIKESKFQLEMIAKGASAKLPPIERGGEGVWAALEAVKACHLPVEEGSAIELKNFYKTLTGKQGKARRHAFFAVRKAQKMLGKISNRNHPLMQKSFRNTSVAVVGAGLMGSGIVMVLLKAGFTVHLLDIYKESLNKGVAFLRTTIQSYAKRGKISTEKAKKMVQSLKPTQKFEDLSSCALVVEAVVENMKVKKKIFSTLDKITPANCILMSNTSSLDIDEMASSVSLSRRSIFLGWHFFSPAHVMKLVEIVRGKDTSMETIGVMQYLTKRIGKIGVVVGNCDGFVGNRLLISYGAETALLLEEGVASVPSIDKAFLKFGIALGPFQMADMAGLDVGYNVRKERGWVLSNGSPSTTTPARYPKVPDLIVSEYKRLGQKSGKGFYDYDKNVGKRRKPLPSKEVNDLIRRYAQKNRTPFTEQQMIERVLFPMVNEGFKCMEEGIAMKPSDIDVVYVYGYGWPIYRGGPMYWADHEVGLPYLLRRLEDFSEQFPETDYYTPSKLLKQCVVLKLTLEDFCNLGLLKDGKKPSSKL